MPYIEDEIIGWLTGEQNPQYIHDLIRSGNYDALYLVLPSIDNPEALLKSSIAGTTIIEALLKSALEGNQLALEVVRYIDLLHYYTFSFEQAFQLRLEFHVAPPSPNAAVNFGSVSSSSRSSQQETPHEAKDAALPNIKHARIWGELRNTNGNLIGSWAIAEKLLKALERIPSMRSTSDALSGGATLTMVRSEKNSEGLKELTDHPGIFEFKQYHAGNLRILGNYVDAEHIVLFALKPHNQVNTYQPRLTLPKLAVFNDPVVDMDVPLQEMIPPFPPMPLASTPDKQLSISQSSSSSSHDIGIRFLGGSDSQFNVREFEADLKTAAQKTRTDPYSIQNLLSTYVGYCSGSLHYPYDRPSLINRMEKLIAAADLAYASLSAAAQDNLVALKRVYPIQFSEYIDELPIASLTSSTLGAVFAKATIIKQYLTPRAQGALDLISTRLTIAEMSSYHKQISSGSVPEDSARINNIIHALNPESLDPRQKEQVAFLSEWLQNQRQAANALNTVSSETPSILSYAINVPTKTKLIQKIASGSGNFILDYRHSICMFIGAIPVSNSTAKDLIMKWPCSYGLLPQAAWITTKTITKYAGQGLVPAISAAFSETLPYIAIKYSKSADKEPASVMNVLYTFGTATIPQMLIGGLGKGVSTFGSTRVIRNIGGTITKLAIPSWSRLVLHGAQVTLLSTLSEYASNEAHNTPTINAVLYVATPLALGALTVPVALFVYHAAPLVAIVWGINVVFNVIPLIQLGDIIYSNFFTSHVPSLQSNTDSINLDQETKELYFKAMESSGIDAKAYLEKALNRLDEKIKLNPYYPDNHLAKAGILVRLARHKEAEAEINQLSKKDRERKLAQDLMSRINDGKAHPLIKYDTSKIIKFVLLGDFEGFVKLLDNNLELLYGDIVSDDGSAPQSLILKLFDISADNNYIEPYVDYLIAKNASVGLGRSVAYLNSPSRMFFKYLQHFKHKTGNMKPLSMIFAKSLERNAIDITVFLLAEGVIPNSAQLEKMNANTALLEALLFFVDIESVFVDYARRDHLLSLINALKPKYRLLKKLYEIFSESQDRSKIDSAFKKYNTLLGEPMPNHYKAHILGRIVVLDPSKINTRYLIEACEAGHLLSCQGLVTSPQIEHGIVSSFMNKFMKQYLQWLENNDLGFFTTGHHIIKQRFLIELLKEPTNSEIINFMKVVYGFNHVLMQPFAEDSCIHVPQIISYDGYQNVHNKTIAFRQDMKKCAKSGTISYLCDTLHKDGRDDEVINAVVCSVLGRIISLNKRMQSAFPYAKSIKAKQENGVQIVTKCGVSTALLINEYVALAVNTLIMGKNYAPKASIILKDQQVCLEYTLPAGYILPEGKPLLLNKTVPQLCLAGMCEIASDLSEYTIVSGKFRPSKIGDKEIDILLGWLVSIFVGDNDGNGANGFGVICKDQVCRASRYYIDEGFPETYNLLGLISKKSIEAESAYPSVELMLMFSKPESSLQVAPVDFSFVNPYDLYPPKSLQDNLQRSLQDNLAQFPVGIPWESAFAEFFQHSIDEINMKIADSFSKAEKSIPNSLLKSAYNFNNVKAASADPVRFMQQKLKKVLDQQSLSNRHEFVRNNDIYEHKHVKDYCFPLNIAGPDELLKGISHIIQCMAAITYVKMLGTGLCLAAKSGKNIFTIQSHPDFTCYFSVRVVADEFSTKELEAQDGIVEEKAVLLSELEKANVLRGVLKQHTEGDKL